MLKKIKRLTKFHFFYLSIPFLFLFCKDAKNDIKLIIITFIKQKKNCWKCWKISVDIRLFKVVDDFSNASSFEYFLYLSFQDSLWYQKKEFYLIFFWNYLYRYLKDKGVTFFCKRELSKLLFSKFYFFLFYMKFSGCLTFCYTIIRFFLFVWSFLVKDTCSLNFTLLKTIGYCAI